MIPVILLSLLQGPALPLSEVIIAHRDFVPHQHPHIESGKQYAPQEEEKDVKPQDVQLPDEYEYEQNKEDRQKEIHKIVE